MKVIGTRTESVEVNVNPLEFLIALFKDEFMDYDPIKNNFHICNNEIFVYSSDGNTKFLLYDSADKVKKFNNIIELITIFRK